MTAYFHRASIRDMHLLDTKVAAKRLRITERRIRALCETGRLGTQVAGRWVITEAELRTFRRRPTGRPPQKTARRKHS